MLKVLLKKQLHKVLVLCIPFSLLITSSVLISFSFKKKPTQKHHLSKKDIKEKFKKFIDKNQEQNTYTSMPEIVVKDFNMKHACDDKKESWALHSKVGKIYKASNKIDCSNVLCELKISNEHVAQLHAEKSTVNRSNKNIFLSGVVTGNFKELHIEGEDINYNFSDQTISSEKELRYAYPNFNLKAEQSRLYIKEHKIEMTGVRTEISHNPTSNHSYN